MVHIYEVRYTLDNGSAFYYIGIHEGIPREPASAWHLRSAFVDGYGGSGTQQQIFEQNNKTAHKSMRITGQHADRSTALIAEGLAIARARSDKKQLLNS